MITNHHAHTRFSDGVGEPRDYLEQAVARGFSTYTFSDHAPVLADGAGCMLLSEMDTYAATIDDLRLAFANQLRIFKSLEVDFLPGVMNVDSDHIRGAHLDFTVGAVHYVDYLADGTPWSFQKQEPIFRDGIEQIFGGDPQKMVERYYALVREMVTEHPPHIVAHLDRVKKRNASGRYWDEHSAWYEAAVEETLDAIEQAGCILEVNTRGLYLKEIEDTYPSRWIVERAHRRGIPLQVNSDAHRPEHVDGAFPTAYGMLRDLGVETVTVFTGTRFEAVELPRWE